MTLREAVDFLRTARSMPSNDLVIAWVHAGRSLREEAFVRGVPDVEFQERIMERELLRRRLLRAHTQEAFNE